MLTPFAIRCDVVRVIAEECDVPAMSLTDETTFDSLKLDSLDFVNLMMAISTAVGKDVPEAKWGELHKVGDVVKVLSE